MSADKNPDTLQRLLDTDEGARRLGEVALVPHSSPISQSGLLYYNTLFDENAASHVALGNAYKFTLKGGNDMSDAEFEKCRRQSQRRPRRLHDWIGRARRRRCAAERHGGAADATRRMGEIGARTLRVRFCHPAFSYARRMDVEETARVWGPGGMRRRGSHHVGGAGAATDGAGRRRVLEPLPMPEILKQYQPIPAERLKNPADGDWPMIRRTYDGWGYSPLDQITPDNVQRLQPAWVFSTSMENGHEAPPVVVNGVMFVATPGNQVLAINARTGTLLWRYRRPLPTPVVLLHPTSRGVAVYNDKVYFAAGEAVLVALDAKTGEEVWTTRVADNASGYYMSLAPLVADGKVLIGTSGGELGIRGYVSAFDAETGKELWKTYMVPAPGEPGSETWPTGEEWKTGGGSVWVTANYDPATNLSFWGTGNGGPWMGDRRPGDNLYIGIDGGDRRRDRPDQRPHAVQPERVVGLGRGIAADSDRLPAQRPNDQRARQRRRATASCISSSVQAARSTSSRRRRSSGKTSFARSIRKQGGPMSIRRGSRAPTRWPTSARRGGAERTGRRPRSTRRRGCSTFRRTRICARRSSAARWTT